MKRVTIKDVAKEAGVSITTVSHALNGGGALKSETRNRVIELARQMNYMPDWNGSNLKTVETRTIGLFTASIRGYYGQLADAMYEKCMEQGYELNIFLTNNSQMLLRSLLSHRVDGAIILHSGFTDEDAMVLLRTEVPTVFLDREMSGKYMTSVLLDSYQAGRMVAEYLIEQGHRRLLFISGEDTYDSRERFRGFKDVLEKYDMPLDDEYRIYGGFNQKITEKAMNEFLDKGLPLPEGVFAGNDESAIGCIKALQDRGYQVPTQVSVVGCDNIPIGKWYAPALTTIDTNITYQGTSAASHVVSMIRRESQGVVEKIPGRIVERQSSIRR